MTDSAMTAEEQFLRATELGGHAVAAGARFLPYRDAALMAMLAGRDNLVTPEGQGDTLWLLIAWLGAYARAAKWQDGQAGDLAAEQLQWAAELGANAYVEARSPSPHEDPQLIAMLDLRGAWSRPFPGEANWDQCSAHGPKAGGWP